MACAKSIPPGQGRMPISDWRASGMGSAEPGDGAAQAFVETESRPPSEHPRRLRVVEAAVTDITRTGPPTGIFQLLAHDPADRGEQLPRAHIPRRGDVHRFPGSLFQREQVRPCDVLHVYVVPRHAFRLFGKGVDHGY